MPAPYIQFRGTPTIVDALTERRKGESLGLTARWVVEQYLAIVEVARTGAMTPNRLLEMIEGDDNVRRGVAE